MGSLTTSHTPPGGFYQKTSLQQIHVAVRRYEEHTGSLHGHVCKAVEYVGDRGVSSRSSRLSPVPMAFTDV